MLSGIDNSLLSSFKTRDGIWSGPCDLNGSNAFNLFSQKYNIGDTRRQTCWDGMCLGLLNSKTNVGQQVFI